MYNILLYIEKTWIVLLLIIVIYYIHNHIIISRILDHTFLSIKCIRIKLLKILSVIS